MAFSEHRKCSVPIYKYISPNENLRSDDLDGRVGKRRLHGANRRGFESGPLQLDFAYKQKIPISKLRLGPRPLFLKEIFVNIKLFEPEGPTLLNFPDRTGVFFVHLAMLYITFLPDR